MRLDKRLADSGIGTRSEVKDIIRKGQVTVNGAVVKDSSAQLSDTDEVICQGRTLSNDRDFYYMFHKPAGCVSATVDREQTVLDFFPPQERKRLFPVGRLDKDTEGLLLLTTDGDFCHRLMSPKKHIDKTYYFEGEGSWAEDAVQRAQEGIDIGDEKPTLPAKLVLLSSEENTQRVRGTLTIYEGRYHQVKRMLHQLGVAVTYLKRTAIGGVSLDETLEKGRYRALNASELALLLKETV